MTAKRSFVPPPVSVSSGDDPVGAGLRLPRFPRPVTRSAADESGDHADSAPPFPSSPASELAADTRIERLPLGLLVDSPYQPRIRYDEDKLAELAESLKHLQLDPVVVRPAVGGKHEIISGHRRVRAAALAQLSDIECRIVQMSDSDARINVLAANEPREDFTDFERALAYEGVLEEGKRSKGEIQSQRQLANRIGVSHTLINRRLAILQLPPVVLDVLRQYPDAFSSNWVDKLKALTSGPFDEKKLREQLIRVATREMQMTALFSVMATPDKAKTAAAPRQALSLQKSNRLFAQITPNVEKRQIMVKLPDVECDVDEVAQLVLSAIEKHYGATS